MAHGQGPREAVPRVTVLMTCRNGGSYLRETLDSLWAQTWSDFELLVLDNASTDGSKELLLEEARRQPRLRVVCLEQDRGQVAALNRGLELIRSPLVARMDADDLCAPTRLERQVAFLEENPRSRRGPPGGFSPGGLSGGKPPGGPLRDLAHGVLS